MSAHAPYIAAEPKVEGRRYQRTGIPAGMSLTYFTAAALAQVLGPEGTFWEFHGHTRSGRPLFGRTRYVADAEGNLAVYSPEGRLVIVHPAGRKIGVLTR